MEKELAKVTKRNHELEAEVVEKDNKYLTLYSENN